MAIQSGALRELALFAGVGGGILAGKLLEWRTVCAVERDAYAAQVLASRQNDGTIEAFPIWSDVCSFDGRPWRGIVDVVSGGFPCQDISVAGAGAGLDGERSGLWREMVRIVREVQPRIVFVENSPALTSRGLGIVLGDLAALGFDAAWGVLGADDCGAPHQRERIWIVAHFNGVRELQPQRGEQEQRGRIGNTAAQFASSFGARCEGRKRAELSTEMLSSMGQGAVPDADSGRQSPRRLPLREIEEKSVPVECSEIANPGGERLSQPEQTDIQREGWRQQRRAAAKCDWWDAEPDVVRVVHGVPFRVDRIRGLGNAQVPAVAASAFRQLISVLCNSFAHSVRSKK